MSDDLSEIRAAAEAEVAAFNALYPQGSVMRVMAEIQTPTACPAFVTPGGEAMVRIVGRDGYFPLSRVLGPVVTVIPPTE